MTTQKKRILKRLQTEEWLSSVEALEELYILRLSDAHLWDLRAEGYEIGRVEGRSYSRISVRPARPITLPPAFPAKPKVDTNALFN